MPASPPSGTTPLPWRDPLLGIALLAALPVWGGLALVQPPTAFGSALTAPGTFLYLAVALPILEEAAFRGLVQEGLARLWQRRWGPLTAANAGQAGLFAALHLIAQPPLWAASVLLPALVFGFFRERHDGLASPIALHAFYNAGFFLLYPP